MGIRGHCKGGLIMANKVIKNPSTYIFKEYEMSESCHECDVEMAVMLPKRIIKKIEAGDEDAGWNYMDEHYFYCKSCQEELGVGAVD